MFGEAQLVPALLASQLKFCVELHFEELERNQVPSDAEISIITGSSSPRNSVVTTRSVAVPGFWKALPGAIQA